MPEITYKEIFGVVTIAMILTGYGRYIFDTIRGKTSPHLYTWIIFLITGLISFFIQYLDGAGPGAWGSLASCITALIILILSVKQGSQNITKSDTISLILGLIAIGLYISVDNPGYTLILLIIIISLAFYPTFRKTYYKPSQETLFAYVLAGARHGLSIIAMLHYSFLTLTIPIFLIFVNIAFVSLALIRKKQLGLK